MKVTGTKLHMTLTDVASLAKVKRPVVSMWRTRSSNSDMPFPAAVATDRGQELFDAEAVASWLSNTGRGNNPQALEDVAAYSTPAATPRFDRLTFDALTSLLAVRAASGVSLASLDSEGILDLADEIDPDDAFLYTELESARQDLHTLASHADRLVDSAYNAAAAFELQLADRFRAGLRDIADTALTDVGRDLLASAAIELAQGLDGDAVFVDPTGGNSDLLLEAARLIGERLPFTLLTADHDGGAARLERRRLKAHSLDNASVPVDKDGAPVVAGAAVHVAQFPSAAAPQMAPDEILRAVEATMLQMDGSQRAVFLAPASVLCDAGNRQVVNFRAEILRSGMVRAIVRLPKGLLHRKPREAQCLWVMGKAPAAGGIEDRLTMVADLTSKQLTAATRGDLVSDIVASMGDHASLRAHAFRFTRPARTSLLLARTGSLVMRKSPAANHDGADAAVRAESLTIQLGMNDGGMPAVVPRSSSEGGGTVTVQAAIAAGNLRYIKGNRLDVNGLSHGLGRRVIGPPELLAPNGVASNISTRFIDYLEFTAKNPSGRLTEPGDVVFCTSPRPAAMADEEGGAVVIFPARILRIDPGDPGGLLPGIVAADINSLPPSDKSWRSWQMRRLPHAERQPLAAALSALQHEERLTRQRLADLNELATLILGGVASGSLTLTEPAVATPATPNEGTL